MCAENIIQNINDFFFRARCLLAMLHNKYIKKKIIMDRHARSCNIGQMIFYLHASIHKTYTLCGKNVNDR